MTSKAAARVWTRFCQRFDIANRCVPLFAVDERGVVKSRVIGRADKARPVLARSDAMEALVLAETGKLVADWQAGKHHYDGLLYCIGLRCEQQFVPLYIGKAESFGRGNGNLSVNISGLERDRTKFARWGDNYAYHIGDLSACVLVGHPDERRSDKYVAWAATMFAEAPCAEPRLRQPVYFWATAWDHRQIGVWEELGPTPLAYQEYLLIGIAGMVSSKLLNSEGKGRSARSRAAVSASSPLPGSASTRTLEGS